VERSLIRAHGHAACTARTNGKWRWPWPSWRFLY